MTLEPKERIIIPDENGEEHLFEVLFSFDVEETGKNYVAVIPVESADDDEVDVYAFHYEMKDDDDNDLALFPIETDEEWDMVEEMLQTLADEEQIQSTSPEAPCPIGTFMSLYMNKDWCYVDVASILSYYEMNFNFGDMNL